MIDRADLDLHITGHYGEEQFTHTRERQGNGAHTMSNDAGRYWLWFRARTPDDGNGRYTSGEWEKRGSFHNKDAAETYRRWWLRNGQPRPTRILIDGQQPN